MKRGFKERGQRAWLEGIERAVGGQKRLAEMLGVNPRTVRGWKEGRDHPRARGIPDDQLERLLKIEARQTARYGVLRPSPIRIKALQRLGEPFRVVFRTREGIRRTRISTFPQIFRYESLGDIRMMALNWDFQ